MGRNPIIRKAVLNALMNARVPLRFSEIKQKVKVLLNRKRIHDRPIAENLKKLVNDGLAEKVISNGHLAYRLTNEYYNQQTKAMIVSLLEAADEKTLYTDLEQNDPPFIAFVEPFKPLREKGTSFFLPSLLDWSDVKYVIAARMLEAFTELDAETQMGIARFLAYAYWYGVRAMIKEPFNNRTIESCKDFALKCIRNAEERGDRRRVEAEKAVISLLDIAAGLISKNNMKDLTMFLMNEKIKVKELQSKIIQNIGHFMAAGEKIFDNFLEFHSCVMQGLYAADLLPTGRKRGSTLFSYRFLVGFSEVWDEFIGVIFNEFLSSSDLEEVKEDLNGTITKIKTHATCMNPLKSLPFQSRICVTYLWGYPQIFQVSDKSFLPRFEQWVKALREGNLDHRSWIFTKGEKELIRAFRAVKRHKPPSRSSLIDLEPWTLRDVYMYHPKGRELDLYKELIDMLRTRKRVLNIP